MDENTMTEAQPFPFSLTVKWREGSTEEEIANAEEFVKASIKEIDPAQGFGLPTAIEELTIRRVEIA